MKSKLLLTSALVGSVAFAGASFAETKVVGNIETTYNSTSENGTGSTGGTLGSETNIGLTSTQELDNGLTATAGFLLENGASDTEYLVVGNDSFNIAVANDYGNNLSMTALPHVSDQAGTVAGTDSTVTYDNIEVANAHNVHHVALNFNGAGGTFTARYAPNTSDSRNGASSVSAEGNSASEIMYKGNFGMDGLTVIAGRGEETHETAAGKNDGENKKYGIGYNFGNFAVGYEKQESESVATASTQADIDSDKFAVTYAASDAVSLGVVYIETEKSSGGAKLSKDEEITMYQAGYSFGGLGIEVSYAEIENAGNATGDSETFQIRTLTKF
jgi:hypothetical protein